MPGVCSTSFMVMYGVVGVSLSWMCWTEARMTEVMGSNAPASPLAKSAER